MTQLTRLALENSLKKLLREKPLNRITISDITNDCGVNRMTFYYHFHDIYDLVKWSCIEDARKMLQDIDLSASWQHGMTKILLAIRDNRVFLMNVYRSISREEVERFLDIVLKPLIDNVIAGLAKDMEIAQEDCAFVSRIYSYCFVGIILYWIKDDMQEEPKGLVDRFSIAIKDSVHISLESFKKR